MLKIWPDCCNFGIMLKALSVFLCCCFALCAAAQEHDHHHEHHHGHNHGHHHAHQPTIILHGDTTELGQKTGEWVERDAEGRVTTVVFYEPNTYKLPPDELLFHGFPSDLDTTFYGEKAVWAERYHYTNGGFLHRVDGHHYATDSLYTLYGPHRELSVVNPFHHATGVVGTQHKEALMLTNHSDQPLELKVLAEDCFRSELPKTITIPPKTTQRYYMTLTLEPGDRKTNIRVHGDSLRVQLPVMAFGYHLRSEDAQQGNTIELKQRALYYRTGTEALLHVYDKRKKELVKTQSLAHHKTWLQLEELEPGRYWLCVEDFSNSSKTWCKATLLK